MLGFDLRRIAQMHRFTNEFEDLGKIGSGGFSQVHKVRNHMDMRLYAAKIVSIKPSLNSEDQNHEKLYRFLAQPKAHALLSHPHILSYHSAWMELETYSQQEKAELSYEQPSVESEFEMVVFDESNSSDDIVFGEIQSQNSKKVESKDEERPRSYCPHQVFSDGIALKDYKQIKIYLLSELCHQNLQDFIARRNISRGKTRLAQADTFRNYELAMDIVRGLMYLHSQRIIHRDMKLHNVMLDVRGKCKIIDFGLAKKVKHWKTSIQQVYVESRAEDENQKYSSSVGTRLFSSPEQANSENYDYRTDIYSLGIIIALLFSNHTTVHQQRQLLQQIRKRNLDQIAIPSPLKELIYRCLAPENERPPLSELEKCLKSHIRTAVAEKISSEEKQKLPCESVIVFKG